MFSYRNRLLLPVFLFLFIACSGGSDSAGGGSTENTGAAIAALFGTDSSGSLNQPALRISPTVVKALLRTAEDEEDLGDGSDTSGGGERNTCDDPDGDGEGDGPEEVAVGFDGEAGTYGASGSGITLDDDDFCRSGSTENSGSGPDGNGLLATFNLQMEVTSTDCDITMESGTGVFRNTDTSYPEVYGTFVINGAEVDCTMFITQSQEVGEGSSCTGEDGSELSLASDASCRLSTESGEDEEDTEDMDGEPMGEDEEDIN